MSPYNSYHRPNCRRTSRQSKKTKVIKFLSTIGTIIFIIVIYLLVNSKNTQSEETVPAAITLAKSYEMPNIKENLLIPNPFSRPQEKLTSVNGIVIHYVGNPGTSAESNRNYFNSLAETKSTYASSHFIIDLDGTIVQCIPLDEISYASNNRNNDTISIEVCHPDETGEFTKESYDALVALTKWLCSKYQLESNAVIRHYDVTGKLCPLYYVKHEDAWLTFKKDIFSK